MAKTDNYVLLTLQIDFETSLHIYVHLNKVVKTKRTFSKHCIGLVNIVFGEDDSAEEVPLEPGGVACLPHLPAAAALMMTSQVPQPTC